MRVPSETHAIDQGYNNNNNIYIYTGGDLTLNGFQNGPAKNIIKT